MREDCRARHRMANVVFDALKKLMPALDRPITWNQDVQRNEFSRSGLTRPQCVKFYTDPFVVLENLPHRMLILGGRRRVHESTYGLSNDPKPVQMMFAVTASAIIGSSRSQLVSTTKPTPATT